MSSQPELWSIETGSGTSSIFVRLHRPAQKNKQCRDSSGSHIRLVILCHGLFATSNSLCSLADAVNEELQERQEENAGSLAGCQTQFCVLTFDFPGCGKSGNPEDWSFGSYEEECSALRCVVVEARLRGFNVECLVGHSRGANVVLLYASEFDDVHRIVSIAARFDMSQGATRHFTAEQLQKLDLERKNAAGSGSFTFLTSSGKNVTITREAFLRRIQLDMKQHVRRIANSSVLLIHGTCDKTIPFEDSLSFLKTLGERLIPIDSPIDENRSDNLVHGDEPSRSEHHKCNSIISPPAVIYTRTVATPKVYLRKVVGAGHTPWFGENRLSQVAMCIAIFVLEALGQKN